MKHPDSSLPGEGFGDSHKWKTEMNRVWLKPMWKCRLCGRSFMRLNANVATDFQLIERSGIPDLCPSLEN